MRLLNTETCKLEEFVSSGSTPEYAILSHTWGEEEVTFQDMVRGSDPTKSGWSKIRVCCRQASKDGWRYVWIDTCCIDKASSSELSEAINSMFNWYKLASVCYAYLADVTMSDPRQDTIRHSRWFQRGWTLQELLAPPFLVFLDNTWTEIGSRADWADEISMVTNITRKVLLGDYMSCNVATKFSWASQRQTTRKEDEAYCLLGLFEVNLPLLYGEDSRAFTRLQEEIIKNSYDESIFAWEGRLGEIESMDVGEDTSPVNTSLLAPSPHCFTNPSINLCTPLTRPQCSPREFHMSNRGFHAEWQVYESVAKGRKGKLLVPLNCEVQVGASWHRIVLPLGKQTKDGLVCHFVMRNGALPTDLDYGYPTQRWRQKVADRVLIVSPFMKARDWSASVHLFKFKPQGALDILSMDKYEKDSTPVLEDVILDNVVMFESETAFILVQHHPSTNASGYEVTNPSRMVILIGIENGSPWVAIRDPSMLNAEGTLREHWLASNRGWFRENDCPFEVKLRPTPAETNWKCKYVAVEISYNKPRR